MWLRFVYVLLFDLGILRYLSTTQYQDTGSFSGHFKSERSRWKPSGLDADDWHIGNWVSARPQHGDEFQVANDLQPITIIWSVETLEQDISVSRPIFASVIAELFDDKRTSDVIFVITSPRRHAMKNGYIYAHTKIMAAQSEYFKTSTYLDHDVRSIAEI